MNFTQQKEVTRKLSDFDSSRARRVTLQNISLSSEVLQNRLVYVHPVLHNYLQIIKEQ